MSKQVDILRLHLPVPGRLVPQAETAGNAVRPEALAEFLANGLKDATAIEAWIKGQAPAMAGLPPLTGQEHLSPRQQIYDRYFDITRHGGSTASIAFSLGQVMGELSREFQLGTSLGEQDISHLLDGLAAVLEAASER